MGEKRQDVGQDARLIVQGKLERDDPTGHEILEGQDIVPVLVKGTAADPGTERGIVDRQHLAGVQKTLGLSYL